MNDQRPCEMEYSRVAPEHVYVRDNAKESVAEKGRGGRRRGGGGGGDAGRRRWGTEGGKWLVGEDDGMGEWGDGGGEGGGRRGQEGPRCAVLHKSISRGCINTTQ